VWSAEQSLLVRDLKRLVARFEDTRDLRAMGGYMAGSDVELDRAIDVVPRLYSVLTQQLGDPVSIDAFAELSAAISGNA
jgi:flagellum-specific ATP synthase